MLSRPTRAVPNPGSRFQFTPWEERKIKILLTTGNVGGVHNCVMPNGTLKVQDIPESKCTHIRRRVGDCVFCFICASIMLFFSVMASEVYPLRFDRVVFAWDGVLA